MKNVTIKSKLLLILYLVVIGFIFLSTIFLFSEKNVILDEKRLKLTNIVELAYSLVEAEYKGDTTKIGYIASLLGGFPGFLIYMWYKKGARRRFIGDVNKTGKTTSTATTGAVETQKEVNELES